MIFMKDGQGKDKAVRLSQKLIVAREKYLSP